MANKCGDCKLFQGPDAECGGWESNRQSDSPACLDSYIPKKVSQKIWKKRWQMLAGYNLAIIITITAIIIYCLISVRFNVFPVDVLPSNFNGAVLGALIGALITFVLLRGQTSLEEDKRKDIRILEKKTDIFQDFINSVWEVWNAQEITVENFDKLTGQYYQNLMIRLKDESKLKVIGNALTAMGKKIEKTTYKDKLELRENIVTIINTLSEDIGLGGKIDQTIMNGHDKIVFPTRLKKDILSKLNEALGVKDTNSLFKEGKYETIWEGRRCLFITFELKGYPGIKLAIGEIGAPDEKLGFLDMVFMADSAIQEIKDFRAKDQNLRLDLKRLDNNVKKVLRLSDPIPDDNYVINHFIKNEDNEPIPRLDFKDEKSMKKFRERDYPDILSKRVLYHLNEWWKIDGDGYIEFFKKHLKQGTQ